MTVIRQGLSKQKQTLSADGTRTAINPSWHLVKADISSPSTTSVFSPDPEPSLLSASLTEGQFLSSVPCEAPRVTCTARALAPRIGRATRNHSSPLPGSFSRPADGYLSPGPHGTVLRPYCVLTLSQDLAPL